MIPESDEHCPFLGRSTVGDVLLCLADIEPVAVSRRYGDSYCLTPGHVNCSLYISAILADRSSAPPILEPIEIVPERVPVAPSVEAPQESPQIQEPPIVVVSRDQAMAIAEDLSRTVDDLVQRVRRRRAANLALLRQMRTLEEMAENPAFLRRMLATGEREPMSSDDLAALQASLQTLLNNPQDLLGLAALAERSPQLERAVNALLQIFRTLG